MSFSSLFNFFFISSLMLEDNFLFWDYLFIFLTESLSSFLFICILTNQFSNIEDKVTAYFQNTHRSIYMSNGNNSTIFSPKQNKSSNNIAIENPLEQEIVSNFVDSIYLPTTLKEPSDSNFSPNNLGQDIKNIIFPKIVQKQEVLKDLQLNDLERVSLISHVQDNIKPKYYSLS